MKIIRIGLLVFSLVVVMIFTAGCPNKPPKVPEIISSLTVDSTYTRAMAAIWVSTTDPNKNGIYYIMDWGDGIIDTVDADLTTEEKEPFPSGETVAVFHMYAKWSPPHDPESKNFEIKAAAEDDKGKIQNNYSEPFSIRVIYNDEPGKPKIFKKNDKGAIKTLQTFKATADDPEGDNVSMRFKFEKLTDWSQLRPSGDTIYGYGQWPSAGEKKVWAIAKDVKGSQSVSSETLSFEVIDEGYVIRAFQAIYVEEGEPETLGFQSSPAIANIAGVDKIFIGSEASYAYIVNTTDMSDEYSIQHVKEDPDDFYEWGNTPAVDFTNSRWFIANDQGLMYGLSFEGGKLWKYPDVLANFPQWSFTDAAISGNYVYAAAEDTLFAFNASGGRAGFYTAPGISFTAAPIIDAQGNILIGDDSGYVRKLNGSNVSSLIWKRYLGGWVATSGAIGSDGTIYFCVNGAPDNLLYALDPDSGSVKWSYSVGEEVSTSFAIDAQGYIYFGDDRGRIHAVKDSLSKSGFPITLYDPTGVNATLSTPSFAADNYFYVMTDEQSVFCIGTDGKVKWETPLPSAEITASKKLGQKREEDLVPSPAIGSDGDIYVASGSDYIGLYRLKGRSAGTPMLNSPWPTFRHDGKRTGKAGTVAK